MNRSMTGKRFRRAAALGIVLTLTAGAVPVWAAPQFSRTAEEWAALQDNKLEYSEISGLVQEYNATVLNARYDYVIFKRDYGETKDDVSDAYLTAANDLWSSLEYPDADDANYASALQRAVSTENAAKNMETQALNNLEDAHIKYLALLKTETQTISDAQDSMITYYTDQLDLKDAESALVTAKNTEAQTAAKVAAGTATQAQLLSAQASVQTAEKTKASCESALNETKQKLIVALGWKANDTPEIGALPELDLTVIDTFNPVTDLETAYANSFTVKTNQRKLENATSQDDIDTLNTTLSDNQQKIASSLTTSYQDVTAKLDAYNMADTTAQVEKTNLTLVQAKAAAGMATTYDVQSQQAAADKADNAKQRAAWNLFKSIKNYQWAVNGLASTN